MTVGRDEECTSREPGDGAGTMTKRNGVQSDRRAISSPILIRSGVAAATSLNSHSHSHQNSVRRPRPAAQHTRRVSTESEDYREGGTRMALWN